MGHHYPMKVKKVCTMLQRPVFLLQLPSDTVVCSLSPLLSDQPTAAAKFNAVLPNGTLMRSLPQAGPIE